MRVTQKALLVAILMVAINATTAQASVITVNPKALGEPDKPFAATSIGLNYVSALSQNSMTGSFSERGGGPLPTFTIPTQAVWSAKPV